MKKYSLFLFILSTCLSNINLLKSEWNQAKYGTAGDPTLVQEPDKLERKLISGINNINLLYLDTDRPGINDPGIAPANYANYPVIPGTSY